MAARLKDLETDKDPYNSFLSVTYKGLRFDLSRVGVATSHSLFVICII